MGSVDLWSPKVVRSGVGGHFRTNLVTGLPADLAVLHDAGLRPLVATAAAEQSADQALSEAGAVALIVGNEAHGVPESVSAAPDVTAISLPMPGGAESLNAGVAAGILMYLRMSNR